MSFFKSYEEKQDKFAQKLKQQVAREKEKEKQRREILKKKSEIKTLYHSLDKKHFLDYKYYWRTMMLAFKPGVKMLVYMQLQNGHMAVFIASIIDDAFTYKSKTYIFDDEMKFWDDSSKRFALYYHQSITMPLKYIIPVNEVKSQLETPGISDVDIAINPSTLRRFIESEFIQKVMQGADIGKDLGFMKTLMMVNTLGIAIILLLVLKSVY